MKNNIPTTIEQAVDQLISDLPIKQKRELVDMAETDLSNLHISMGVHIRNEFNLWDNPELMESCRIFVGDDFLHEDSASTLIIRELWKRLRTLKKLKVVK